MQDLRSLIHYIYNIYNNCNTLNVGQIIEKGGILHVFCGISHIKQKKVCIFVDGKKPFANYVISEEHRQEISERTA